MAEGFEGLNQGSGLTGGVRDDGLQAHEGSGVSDVGGVRGAATQVKDAASARGRDLLDRAVEQKDALRQRASGVVDAQRLNAAGRVDAISRALQGAASSLRDSGEPQLSSWVEQAAGQVQRLVGYLEGKPADGMLHDFEDLARRNPALFLGGTYLAGMAVGRFLRASTPTPSMGDSGAGAFPDDGMTSGMGETAPWTGVGMAPSTQGGFGTTGIDSGVDDGFRSTGYGAGGASAAGLGTSGYSAGASDVRASDAGDGEAGLTDEEPRNAWHGTGEAGSSGRTGGYGASSGRASDAIDTGELTSYTNDEDINRDPRGM